MHIIFSKYLIITDCNRLKKHGESVDKCLHQENNDKIESLQFARLRNNTMTYD